MKKIILSLVFSGLILAQNPIVIPANPPDATVSVTSNNKTTSYKMSAATLAIFNKFLALTGHSGTFDERLIQMFVNTAEQLAKREDLNPTIQAEKAAYDVKVTQLAKDAAKAEK